MNIILSARSPQLGDGLRRYVQETAAAALAGLSEALQSVEVVLAPIVGPDQRIYQRCLLMLELADGQRRVVEHTHAEPHEAIDRALARVAKAIARRPERRTPFGWRAERATGHGASRQLLFPSGTQITVAPARAPKRNDETNASAIAAE